MIEHHEVVWENDELVQIVDFDFNEVEARLGTLESDEAIGNLDPKQVEAVCAALRRVFSWIWFSGSCNSDTGLGIRAAIVCRAFLPDLKDLTLEDLAHAIGKKHKQSLHRHMDGFREALPFLAWNSKRRSKSK